MVMAVFAFGLNGYNARSCLPIYDRASGSDVTDVNKVGAFVCSAGSVEAYHVKSAQPAEMSLSRFFYMISRSVRHSFLDLQQALCFSLITIKRHPVPYFRTASIKED